MLNDLETVKNAFEMYKKEVDILSEQLDTALGLVATKQLAIDNLTTTIKHIHMTLNANNHLFDGNADIDGLVRELAKFIISSEAIKSGVRKNAIN